MDRRSQAKDVDVTVSHGGAVWSNDLHYSTEYEEDGGAHNGPGCRISVGAIAAVRLDRICWRAVAQQDLQCSAVLTRQW